MKLDDPQLQALVEAYRAQCRPSAAQRRDMLQRYRSARRFRAPRHVVVAGVVAVAAAVLLVWLVVRGSTQVPLHHGAGPGTQAPFDVEAPGAERVDARSRHGRGQGQGEPVAPEPSPSVDAPESSDVSESAPQPPHARPRARPSAKPTRAPEPEATLDSGGSGIEDEVTLIEAAETALRGGRARQALSLLDRHQREHPDATTVEDRRALRVLALCALGRTVEGRGAQFSFLRDYPHSAYRARVEGACASE